MAVDVPGGILKQSDVRETITNTEEVGVGWNLAYIRYDRRFNTALAADLRGIYISPDGYHIYICRDGGAASYVYQYLLGTAWDISTASFVQNLEVTAKEVNIQGVHFKPDGTKMYTIGRDGESVDEYNLTTAWDISTAAYSQEFDVGIVGQGMFIREDGKQMFVSDGVNTEVDSYNITTAWDITTAEYVEKGLNLASPRGLWFSRDGTYVFMCDGTILRRWTMTTVFSIATAAADTTYTPAPAGNAQAATFKANGSKMYMLVGTYIQEYTIKRGWR